jgi:Prokaryotic Cytochrome C oxidase subunit IV
MTYNLFRNKTTLVWSGLIAATLMSWFVGVGHELGEAFAGVVILLIAFVKVRFVGRYFMELRHAPFGLVAVFDAWIVVVASALIGLFVHVA